MTTATMTAAPKLPKDARERHDRLAKSTGRTKTHYMAGSPSESIDRLEYEYGILRQIEDYRTGRQETYSIDKVWSTVARRIDSTNKVHRYEGSHPSHPCEAHGDGPAGGVQTTERRMDANTRQEG